MRPGGHPRVQVAVSVVSFMTCWVLAALGFLDVTQLVLIYLFMGASLLWPTIIWLFLDVLPRAVSKDKND